MSMRTTLCALALGAIVAGCVETDPEPGAPVGRALLALAPENTLPPAQTTNEDSTLFFSVDGANPICVTDPDNPELTVEIIVTNGTFRLGATAGLTVTGNGTGDVIATGSIENLNNGLGCAGERAGSRFVPNANYAGPATLTINTSDYAGETDLDVLDITVTPFNDPPRNLVPTTAQAATEDVPKVFTTILVSDVDVGDEIVEVSLSSTAVTTMTLGTVAGLTFTAGDGTLDAAMTFTGDLPSVNSALNGLTVTPQANYIGSSSLTITSRDLGHTGAGVPGEDADTVNISWAAVNDPPVNVMPPAQSTNEEQPVEFSAAEGNALTSSDVDALVSLVQVTLSAASGRLDLGDPSGVTFTSGDGISDTSMTFQATIADANAAMDGTIFTPNANFAGAAAVTLLTNDLGNSGSGGAKADSDSVVVNVAGVNDAPANSVPGAQTTNEDVARIFSVANGNAITVADVDATSLQITLTATNGTLTLPSRTGLIFTAGDGTADVTTTFSGTVTAINTALNGLALAPTANFNGAASVAITSNDLGATGAGGAGTDSDTIAVTVSPVNDPPTAVNDAATMAEDGAAIGVNVLTNDSSAPDTAETLSVSAVTDPAHGTATTDGTAVSYGPDGNFFGVDTVYYTLSDGSGGTATGVLTVTVTPVNDAPTANDDAYTVVEEAPATFPVLANDTYAPDGAETLSITGVTDPPHGTASIVAGGISYTPDAAFVGADSFTYTISDGNGGTDTATVSVTVTAGAVPPTNSLPPTQSVTEDTPLLFNAASGNTISVADPDSATVTMFITTDHGTFTLGHTTGLTVSGSGTASVQASGSVASLNAGLLDSRLNVTANYSGVCTISIYSIDGTGGSDTDALTVMVTAINDAPANTVPGATACQEDVPKTFATISVNDVDIGDAELVVTLTATNGTVITLATTAGVGFTAGDGVNDSTVTFGGPLPNVNTALNGLTVIPPSNYIGSSTLSISSSDQGATGAGPVGVDNDSITLSWAAVNDAPINAVPATGTLVEDTSFAFDAAEGTGLSVTDNDLGGASMRVTLTTVNGTLTLGSPGSVTYTSGDGISDASMVFDGTLTAVVEALQGSVFTPTANFAGTATVTMLSSDQGNTGTGGARTDTDVVTLTVTGVNDAPTIALPAAQTTNEDTAKALSSATANAVTIADADATSLQLTVSASDGTVTLARTTGLGFTAGDGTADASMTFYGTVANINSALNGMSFIPTAGFYGAAGLTFLANDLGVAGEGGALFDVDTLVINVTAVNDPPDAVNDALTITEDDGPTVVPVLDNDTIWPDVGETLSITVVSDPAHGTTTLVDQVVTYQPDPDFNGVDTFTYTVSDGTSFDSATVTVTVGAVNDNPTAVDDEFTVGQNSVGNTLNVLANDSAAPDTGETITVTAVSDASHGVAVVTVGGGSVTYTPNPGHAGPDSFTYTISDGHDGTSTATIAIDVSDVAEVPEATDDTLALDEDTSAIVDVLANDTGLGDAPLVVTISVAPAHGTAVVQADNTVLYTPNPDYTGADSFTYTVTDNNGDNDSAVVAVTVNPVDDAPIANNDDVTVDEDDEVNFDVLDNDEGMVDAPLVVSIVTPPVHGTATVETDTTITYEPDEDYNGEDSFTYGVTDADGDIVTATVSVTVTPVNDDPVAVDDSATTDVGVAVEIDVLENDSDVEDDELTVTATTTPAHGTATIGASGVVTYEPQAGFEGTDEFEYTVQDEQGGEGTAVVTVEVGLDTDDDGLVDSRELELGTDPTDPDTDDDLLMDGLEVNVAETDPLDDDSDDDGLLDGAEDADHDGAVGETETSPLDPDSDADGVQDGTESGQAEPAGEDTDEAVFVPDGDPTSTTDPLDTDSDDDGLLDGTEDADHDGEVDESETNPGDDDTDGDGLSDGLELGLTEPEGEDTDMTVFVPDADPATTTDPTLADTDRMGRPDGVEDANHNGRVDEGETDPNDGTDDTEPLGEGCDCGAASSRPSGTPALLLFALAAFAALRRRRG